MFKLDDLLRVHAPIASNSYEFYVKSYRKVGDAVLYYGRTATGGYVNAVHPRYCKLVRKSPVACDLPCYDKEEPLVAEKVPEKSLLDDVNLYTFSKEDLGLSDVSNLTVEEICKKFDVQISVDPSGNYKLFKCSDQCLTFKNKDDLIEFLQLQDKYLQAVSKYQEEV